MAERKTSLDIGRVLSATFTVIGRQPLVFLGLAMIVAGLPYGVMQYFTLNLTEDPFFLSEEWIGDFETQWPSIFATGFGIFVLYFILTVLLQAMLIVATIRDLRGQEVDMGACFTEALNRFLPLAGLAIVSLFGILLGLMLFIVPGVIIFLMWIVATPAMMAERLGIIDSLRRSAELTSGSKGMILLLAFIYAIGASMMGGFGEALGFFSTNASVLAVVVTETAVAAVQAAGVAALYIELRTVKEGPMTETLADVFA